MVCSGGRVVSALSVQCIRSCAPFCSGCPGAQRQSCVRYGRTIEESDHAAFATSTYECRLSRGKHRGGERVRIYVWVRSWSEQYLNCRSFRKSSKRQPVRGFLQNSSRNVAGMICSRDRRICYRKWPMKLSARMKQALLSHSSRKPTRPGAGPAAELPSQHTSVSGVTVVAVRQSWLRNSLAATAVPRRLRHGALAVQLRLTPLAGPQRAPIQASVNFSITMLEWAVAATSSFRTSGRTSHWLLASRVTFGHGASRYGSTVTNSSRANAGAKPYARRFKKAGYSSPAFLRPTTSGTNRS